MKDRIFEQLKQIWDKKPDLRFCDLISDITYAALGDSEIMGFKTDKDFLEACEWVNKDGFEYQHHEAYWEERRKRESGKQ